MVTNDQRVKARRLKIRVRLHESPILARYIRMLRRRSDILSTIVDELLDDGRNGLHKEDE
jgi:hypothetical protein